MQKETSERREGNENISGESGSWRDVCEITYVGERKRQRGRRGERTSEGEINH